MEVLQMFRRKAEKRMVELSPNEARLMREALLAFRNKLLSAGKPTEDVNELIIKVMKLGREISCLLPRILETFRDLL